MSAKKRSKAAGKEANARPDSIAASTPAPTRKSRRSDLGRALRTVYDDTLRESVPDDFMDLLRKLS